MSGTLPAIFFNRPNLYNFLPFIIISTILCLGGLYGYIRDSVINFLVLALTLSFFLFLALYIREFVRRPKFIEVNDDNIILKYRYNKTKFISWNENIEIFSYERSHFPILGRLGEGGAIVSENLPRGVLTTYEISLKLRESYKEKRGHFPPGKSE